MKNIYLTINQQIAKYSSKFYSLGIPFAKNATMPKSKIGHQAQRLTF